jgi:hypothetical protein
MACDERDPATITFNFMSALGVRDASMALTPPTANMSLTHYTYTLQFCWAALNTHLAHVIYSIADYSFIIAWGEELHSHHIIQVSDPHTAPIPSRTAFADETVKDMGLTLATNNLEINHVTTAANDAKKLPGFGKLPSHTHNMILMAASPHHLAILVNPPAMAQDCFEQTTVGKARSHLRPELRSKFNVRFDPYQALSAALHAGHLL